MPWSAAHCAHGHYTKLAVGINEAAAMLGIFLAGSGIT